MSVKIIVDSGSDIPQNNSDGVIVVPMRIAFGSKEYRDGDNLSHEEFYEMLKGTVLPKTSQVTPGEFMPYFKSVADAGDEAVVVTMSSKLSGTYASAVSAAAHAGKGIYVVDSMNVSVSERALVDLAVRYVKSGMSAAETAKQLEKERGRLVVVSVFDTLEYLMKGGRISKAAAIAGSIFAMKPVMGMKNGEVVLLGKARGTKLAHNMLNGVIEKAGGVDFSMPIRLGYTGFGDELLKKYVEGSMELWRPHVGALPVGSIGCTIGTHAGPGAVAAAFFHN